MNGRSKVHTVARTSAPRRAGFMFLTLLMALMSTLAVTPAEVAASEDDPWGPCLEPEAGCIFWIGDVPTVEEQAELLAGETFQGIHEAESNRLEKESDLSAQMSLADSSTEGAASALFSPTPIATTASTSSVSYNWSMGKSAYSYGWCTDGVCRTIGKAYVWGGINFNGRQSQWRAGIQPFTGPSYFAARINRRCVDTNGWHLPKTYCSSWLRSERSYVSGSGWEVSSNFYHEDVGPYFIEWYYDLKPPGYNEFSKWTKVFKTPDFKCTSTRLCHFP